MAPPTKSDIRAATPDMLNKDLYVVTTTPVDGMDAVMTNLEEHLAFQVDLERRGIMFGAGPLWEDDEHSWNGEGLASSAPTVWPTRARSRSPIRCTAPAPAASPSARG